MTFSHDDKVLIRHYCMDEGYGPTRILNKFPDKGWTLNGLKTLVANIKERDGDLSRKEGSGRPRCAATPENIDAVETLILSQEDQPGTHLTQRRIASELGISQASVSRISTDDLGLHAFKKIPG